MSGIPGEAETEARTRRAKASAAWRKANPERSQSANLKWKYGISFEDHARMLVFQAGGCAICERTSNPDGRSFAVDHDHACCPDRPTCGKCLRGLLCIVCNTRLNAGLQLDETLLSRREFNYLHLWRKRIARERPNPWDEL